MIELYRRIAETCRWIRTNDERIVRKWLTDDEIIMIKNGKIIKKEVDGIKYEYSAGVTK